MRGRWILALIGLMQILAFLGALGGVVLFLQAPRGNELASSIAGGIVVACVLQIIYLQIFYTSFQSLFSTESMVKEIYQKVFGAPPAQTTEQVSLRPGPPPVPGR